MDTVAFIAGQTITVGTIATFSAQLLKGRDWFPERFRATLIRLFVAAVCVLVNATVASFSGQVLEPETLIEAFLSYTVAAAAYDHLFKN